MAVMTQAEFQQKYNRAPSHEALPPEAPKSLGDTIGGVAQGVSDFVGAKGLTDLAGSQFAKLGLAATGNMKAANQVEEPSMKQVLGSAIQTGANFIPGATALKSINNPIVKGAAKVGLGAATGYAMDTGSKLQSNDPTVGQPGAATVVGGALPVAAGIVKPGVAILGRLLKGIGSGLSGVPVHQIEQIFNNPEAAQKATQQIAKAGKGKVLEDNARTIVEGVGKVRQEARATFGKAMEGLKAEDINPQNFRAAIQPVLDKVGSSVSNGQRNFDNAGFSDPKNVQKASELIDRLNILPNGKMDGATLRKLADDIESAKYKVGSSDERLSFNAFLGDLSSGVKGAINASTDKLKEANAAFSNDAQLADAVQGIFGKVKFKNLSEVNRASQKLETLFQQKGLSPEVTNDFLKRIGVDAEGFKAGEAVRQLVDKEGGANSVGLGGNEVLRALTSSIVTPEMVGAISAKTGMAKATVEPFLRGLSTSARNAVLQALVQPEGTAQETTQ